jgi:hypothetical protein
MHYLQHALWPSRSGIGAPQSDEVLPNLKDLGSPFSGYTARHLLAASRGNISEVLFVGEALA